MRRPSLTLSTVLLAAFLATGCDPANLLPGDDPGPLEQPTTTTTSTTVAPPAPSTTEAPDVPLTTAPDLPSNTIGDDTDTEGQLPEDQNRTANALQAIVDHLLEPHSWETRTGFDGTDIGTAWVTIAGLTHEERTYLAGRRYRITLTIQAGQGLTGASIRPKAMVYVPGVVLSANARSYFRGAGFVNAGVGEEVTFSWVDTWVPDEDVVGTALVQLAAEGTSTPYYELQNDLNNNESQTFLLIEDLGPAA